MLVLGRKVGETIVIGDVVVHFLSSRGGTIRLGIEAPRDVPITRGELAQGAVTAPCLVEIESWNDQR